MGQLGLARKPRSSPALGTFNGYRTGAPPDEWDWRTKNIVNPVKNQKQCGSCWAFSAVAAMESRYALDTKTLKSFSEQELVDCVDKGYDDCQRGGEMHDGVMEIVIHHHSKINTEQQYPYVSGNGRKEKCKEKDNVAIQ